MLVDVRHLQESVNTLKHVGATADMVVTVVQEKAVAGVAPPSKNAPSSSKSRLSAKMAAVVAGAAGQNKESERVPVPVPEASTETTTEAPSDV